MAAKITKIGETSDKISARGGLPLFLRYVEKIGLYSMISGVILPHILQTNKGLQLQSFLKQIIAFFIDGSNMAISGFDQSKKDDAYASLLECAPKQLASSHQIKRYFQKLSFINNMIFNYIGLADKLRMLIFRCAAPLVSILFVFPTKIIATLWLNFQVQRTGNLWCAGHVVNLKGARVNPQVPREP